MNCNVCGAPNVSAARLCAQCGSVLTARCPACAVAVQAEARFCSACGQSLVPPSAGSRLAQETDPKMLTGERKQVTILFADFSDFTAFAAQLDPEDLRDTMNSIWTKLDAIITAHGGLPEKHIGDAIMAVFGGRRSREEDPVETVRAALAMQNWLKSRPAGNERFHLQMRIGIHTGLLVVPQDGSGELLAGDAVNLASRLEHSAPVGGVLISRETYRHVHGFFDARALPLLEVKGKSEPVETYLILCAKPRALALQMRGIEGVETEMIGRQEELNRLLSSFEKTLQQGILQVMTVVAEAGIGKSRLFREFQKKTDLLPQYFRFFCGRTTTESASQPFALIRDLFCARFEIQESDPAALAREKFERGLASLLVTGAEREAWSRQELMPTIHLIGQLLGLDFSASPHLRDILGEVEQIRQRAFHSFCRLMAAISQSPATEHSPKLSAIMLVVEDLHWCDDASLDLLEHLVRHCQGVPLMILCSMRPAFFERRPNWCKGLPNVTRLNLEPLSPSESNALVEAILHKAPAVPAALREWVTAGAEGNPFYIEEMIKMLVDQKVILPQAELWQIELGRLVQSRLPSTLTGVLQARLDGLAPLERLVLQRASVVGRVFWDSTVEHIGSASEPSSAGGLLLESPLSQADISRALEGLGQKELVFRRETSAFAGSVEYRFKHELLRNVAYESLLKKSRRQHHARVAEWLKNRSADRIHEFAGLVATHFEQASLPADAAEWYGRAGHQARLSYEPVIASQHFKKALELLPHDGAGGEEFQRQQLEWQEGLGETLGSQGRFSEALEACAAARKLAEQFSDPVAQARSWNSMAFFHERRGDNRASILCAEQAETLAVRAAEAGLAERIRALHFRGWTYYRLGDAPAVLALGEQTLALCSEQGDRRGAATSFKLLGVANLQLGRYAQADRFFQQGLALFDELGDRRNTAAMYSNRAETARACGDCQTAVELYEKALGIARQIGNVDGALIYQANLSGARLGLRQFEQAETDLRQVISQTLTPNSCILPEAYTFLSEAYLGQGNLCEAVQTALKAIALAQESENSLYLGGAWRALGRIGARVPASSGQSSGPATHPDLSGLPPLHCFAESLRLFRLINAEGEQAVTLRAWAEYELEQGHLAPGCGKLQEAREIFLRLGATFEIATTESLLRRHSAVKTAASSGFGI
jgi:class 3 adenylate cyclase/tetratricopeptide (TPR) repeat protein